MDELQEQQTGPINPYAQTFFWIWGLALLALAGFRTIQPTRSVGHSVEVGNRQPRQLTLVNAVRDGFSTDQPFTIYLVRLFHKAA